MKRYNLYITEKQLEILEKLAESSISVSEHIRMAIDLYIQKLQKALISESPSKKGGKNVTDNKSGN